MPAFDGEAVQTSTTPATTHTVSGKTTAGTNRFGVWASRSSFDPAANYPQWNGVSMTLIRQQETLYVYGIVNPPTAASDVVTQWAGGAPGGNETVVWSYNDVHQTTPVRGGSATGDSQTSGTPSIAVTSQAGDLVVDVIEISHIISAAGSGQTQRGTAAGGSRAVAVSDEAGAASVTMDWSVGGSAAWDMVGFSLAPPAAAASILRQMLMQHG
jgi:hypothetical protein